MKDWFRATACAVLLAATLPAPPTGAQTTQAASPLMQHYRAYVSAREVGDYKRAETEGAAALAAAEAARDGRAGVLAFNLATLRAFELNDLPGARVAAEKAIAFGGAGVSPPSVQLIVAVSRLETDHENARRTLTEAMTAARSDPRADVDFLYRVARAWALTVLRDGRRGSAEEGFGHAVDLARRMSGDTTIDVSFALIEHGVLLVARGEDESAYARLHEAARILAPKAGESVGEKVPVEERLWAEAAVWMGVIQSKNPRNASREKFPATPSRPGLAGAAPLCERKLIAVPPPRYPREAIEKPSVGSLMVRLSVGADGTIRRAQIVAAVPRQNFTEAVMAVASRWRVEWAAGGSCRRETDDLVAPIRFRIE